MRTALVRFRTAAWFGWMADSNWTDPFLFLTYAVARPLATGLIVVGMYWAVRRPGPQDVLFAGFFVANAFHTFVNTVVVDMGWIVFSEREEYETLRYVVASPVGMRTYFAGRAMVKFARAALSAALLLALGWFALGVRWPAAATRLGPLALAIALGLVTLLFASFLVAGLSMLLTRQAIVLLDGLTLGFYLLCGVIFPIDLLPRVLQWVSLALPFTWWYEALRRFLLGHGSSARLGALGDGALLGGLLATSVVFSAASFLGYSALERRARQLGRIDQTTLF
jgi:ABC-type multidrug transport system permease subunit